MNDLKFKWNPKLYNDKHAFVYNYGEDLVRLLDPKPGESILDIGCGSGQLTNRIYEFGSQVIGMDMSKEMIADARNKYPRVKFIEGDASNFHFKQPYDAIFSNATLHWVLDYKNAAKCMFNALKPGGRIILEFGGKGNIQSIVRQLRASLSIRGYNNQSQLQLWYFPSIGQYSGLLEATGFKVSLAQLYDRPTELSNKQTGIKDWLTMFAKGFFKGVKTEHQEEIINEVQEKLKAQYLIGEKWIVDYKRIRIVATKNYK